MRKYTIEDAKRLISDFCEEEYGTENIDFSNLECIGLAEVILIPDDSGEYVLGIENPNVTFSDVRGVEIIA